MKPLRIRISRIVDLGTIVSLSGVDTETSEPISIHVDHRPAASFWEAWREAGFPQPIEYEADRLLLRLDMVPADDGDAVDPVEYDDGCEPATACHGCRPAAREVER